MKQVNFDFDALMTAKSVATWLQHEFDRRRASDARYSLRRFADQLRVSPGTLSEVLSGKRFLGVGVARRIANALLLDDSARFRLLQLVVAEVTASRHARNQRAAVLLDVAGGVPGNTPVKASA